MTRALTRTNFHSSQLIRTLADLAVLETTEPTLAFAEKLGLWIDFTDAIALCAVHNASTAKTQPAAPPAAGVSLVEAFAKVRTSLENTITSGASPKAGRARPELSMPKLDMPIDDANAYAPYRRYHQAHQRDMETNVRSLRASVRDALAKGSPQLKQLAAAGFSPNPAVFGSQDGERVTVGGDSSRHMWLHFVAKKA